MRTPFWYTLRSQDRYRDRRTDVPNDLILLEALTYLLKEGGDNIILEQGVGTAFDSGTAIPT